MRLYLDDDSVAAVLIRLLQLAGHDVRIPADIGMAGEDDPVHLLHAIREDRALLSRNHDDFEQLHDLILQAQGHHPGILIVRRDNDPSKDLKPAGIVRAIRNLEAANIPIRDSFHVLNQWR
jgi:predicted nuclease of predicted toxin-antitoxin system